MSNQVATINQNQQIKPSGGFDLRPQNISEAHQLATMIANSQLAPKDFKGKPDDTLVAMMMGNELGLNPMQSIQNIAVINGRPSIWGDAMLALVQNHPSFGGIKETFDDSTMTATCTVWRKGGDKHTVTFSQADAQQAGLWGKQGPWKQYPKRMLPLRARGYALRDQFADALLGLISAEEAQDIPEQEGRKQSTYQPSIEAEEPLIEYYSSEEFNEKYGAWSGLIGAGKKTANDLIAMVQSKGKHFTDDQKMQLVECEYKEQTA